MNAAQPDNEMTPEQLNSFIGAMLEYLQPQIGAVCSKWIADEEDIRDLLITVDMTHGVVVPESRKAFCKRKEKSLIPHLRQTAHDIRQGQPGLLPVVILFDGLDLVHACWIAPVAPGEIQGPPASSPRRCSPRLTARLSSRTSTSADVSQ